MFYYEEKRILIWGKTYPELSSKYTETVCTGGVLEDGSPVRLYPIPFRYLEGEKKFGNYQWITARIAKDTRDTRPESFRIEENSIVCGEEVRTTPDEWGKRAEIVFRNPKWLFDSVETLRETERQNGASLGVVEPKEIFSIKIKNRGEEDEQTFSEKLQQLRQENEAKLAQIEMFEEFTPPELKRLSYVPSRFEIHWQCHGENCKKHHTQALDWGLIELQRRIGVDAAQKRLEEICNLKEHALKFFMGNIHNHPTAFTIVGLWYPKRAARGLFW